MIDGAFTYSTASELKRVWSHAGWEIRLEADQMEGYYHIMARRPPPKGTQESRWG